MESGSIASWRVAEGDSFQPGDSLAEIQTDKASMAFEAQDAGYVAKLLVKGGDGTDIKIGEPIMVTVEEKDYVPEFRDFSISKDTQPKKTNPVSSAVPVEIFAAENVSKINDDLSVSSSPSIPSVIVESPVPSFKPSNPVTQLASPTSTPIIVVTPVIPASASSPLPLSWGNLGVRTPLGKILSIDQRKYIEKFGSTGHLPL